jgi:FixJ family two-component response regulator
VDARAELRAAYDRFCDFGMLAFAERAWGELQATGEHARKRTADTLDELTPQEARVARLAANGHTNREIATQLVISPSTVELGDLLRCRRGYPRSVGVDGFTSDRTARY